MIALTLIAAWLASGALVGCLWGRFVHVGRVDLPSVVQDRS